jgi:glycosyltransferase involved in cell wall biosynthesis
MPYISVVTPVYGCKTCLYELYIRLNQTLEIISPDYEIIMVNDASPDGAWETIVELAQKDRRVKGITLSRNFGQHYAITAGLKRCCGEWVVVMDCDLQDQPEEILKLYQKVTEGFDIVFGRRVERKDTFKKRFFSKVFTLLLQFLSGEKIDNSIGNFSIVSRRVIEKLNSFTELNRNYGLFLFWMGYKSASIEIDHVKRPYGKSSYSFSKSLNHAITSMVTYSTKPLRLSIKFGFIISVFSFLLAIYYISRYFLYDIGVPGFTSMIVTIFFVSGIIIMNLGLLGLYIGKIFEETKRRPLYIEQDLVNF